MGDRQGPEQKRGFEGENQRDRAEPSPWHSRLRGRGLRERAVRQAHGRSVRQAPDTSVRDVQGRRAVAVLDGGDDQICVEAADAEAAGGMEHFLAMRVGQSPVAQRFLRQAGPGDRPGRWLMPNTELSTASRVRRYT